SSTKEGLGIGLALARRLVEMHRGRLTASSAGIGQGSTFSIRLPLLLEADVSASPSESSLTPTPSKLQRILIADDNQDAADSLAMLLRLGGHEVLTVYDGLAAVESAAAQRPDVIV